MNQKFGDFFLRALILFGSWTAIAFTFNIGW
jgi:hypothetical protein